MGGTCVPHGGHNMLEPARWGKPVVFGPSIDNFRDIALGLLAYDAAVMVRGVEDLPAALGALCDAPEQRAALGARAFAMWDQGRGSVHRYRQLIDGFLRKENATNG
jgi:3-deoxy-D-manno-octulosonic-acid transferase